MTRLALVIALSLTGTAAMAAPQQLIDSVRAELSTWGMGDIDVSGLRSHKLNTIKHILHSNSSPSAKRGKVLAIIDPQRYSLRGLFK